MTGVSVFLCAAIVSLLAVGCVVPYKVYTPNVTLVSDPPLRAEAIANIGDRMLKQVQFVQSDAIHIEAKLKLGIFHTYIIPSGIYNKFGENKDSEFYDSVGVQNGRFSDTCVMLRLYKDRPRICAMTFFNGQTCGEARGITKTNHTYLADESSQQTLIYNGRAGSKVSLAYRVFSDGRSRRTYNSDAVYDLNESRIIGYNGARIEVIEATNELIRYRVLKNFNEAER